MGDHLPEEATGSRRVPVIANGDISDVVAWMYLRPGFEPSEDTTLAMTFITTVDPPRLTDVHLVARPTVMAGGFGA